MLAIKRWLVSAIFQLDENEMIPIHVLNTSAALHLPIADFHASLLFFSDLACVLFLHYRGTASAETLIYLLPSPSSQAVTSAKFWATLRREVTYGAFNWISCDIITSYCSSTEKCVTTLEVNSQSISFALFRFDTKAKSWALR